MRSHVPAIPEYYSLHALAVDSLPAHHRDPFDRMLIAQALSEQMTLLTADRVCFKSTKWT